MELIRIIRLEEASLGYLFKKCAFLVLAGSVLKLSFFKLLRKRTTYWGYILTISAEKDCGEICDFKNY